jgi:hypothetical protein
MWYRERNDATSTTVPGGIFRRRKVTPMPIHTAPSAAPIAKLEVKACLDLASAMELADDMQAIIKDAVMKAIRDGLREAADQIAAK